MSVTEADLNDIISIFRQCVSQCFNTLDMLTFMRYRYQNLHICKKDCIASALSQWVLMKPYRYKYAVPCMTKCIFQWFKHNDKTILLNCLNKCVGWF